MREVEVEDWAFRGWLVCMVKLRLRLVRITIGALNLSYETSSSVTCLTLYNQSRAIEMYCEQPIT